MEHPRRRTATRRPPAAARPAATGQFDPPTTDPSDADYRDNPYLSVEAISHLRPPVPAHNPHHGAHHADPHHATPPTDPHHANPHDPPAMRPVHEAQRNQTRYASDHRSRGRLRTILAILVVVLLLTCLGIAYYYAYTQRLGTSTVAPQRAESVPTQSGSLPIVPAGSYRLTAGDMIQACIDEYGAGTTAGVIRDKNVVPSYWWKCSGHRSLHLTESACSAHLPGSRAENPYRACPETSQLKPWDWWYCYP